MRWPTLSLKAWLLVIAFAATLPLIAAIFHAQQRERRFVAHARSAMLEEKARAAAGAVALRFRLARQLLKVAGSSQEAERRDMGSMYEATRHLLGMQRLVQAVEARDDAGELLFVASLRPEQARLPAPLQTCGISWRRDLPERLDPVATLRDVAGDRQWLASVPLVPNVAAGCRLRGILPVASLSQALRDQNWPADWIASIVDADLRIVARSQGEEALKAVQGRVLEAQEGEKRRLARELHDQLGQELALLQLTLQSMRLPADPGAEPAKSSMRDAIGQVGTLLERVRSLALDLRPAQLDDLGPEAALQGLARRARESSPVAFDLALPAPMPRLPDTVETAIFRVVQAASTNALRHAGATRVRVGIALEGEHATVTIQDDGCGFDPATPDAGGSQGIGLLIMQERVDALDGELRIASAPGQGTTITARLPVAGPTEPAA